MTSQTARTGVRRTAAALALAAAGTAGSVVLDAGPASAAGADPDGCVTRKEFRQVEKGDTQRQVRKIFGTAGELGNGGGGGFEQLYPQCTSAFTRGAAATQGHGCQVSVEFVVRGSGKPKVLDKKFNGVCPD